MLTTTKEEEDPVTRARKQRFSTTVKTTVIYAGTGRGPLVKNRPCFETAPAQESRVSSRGWHGAEPAADSARSCWAAHAQQLRCRVYFKR